MFNSRGPLTVQTISWAVDISTNQIAVVEFKSITKMVPDLIWTISEHISYTLNSTTVFILILSYYIYILGDILMYVLQLYQQFDATCWEFF